MDRVRRTDRFIAYSPGSISSADYQVLVLLYLPIIGVFAFALYMTLRELLDKQDLASLEYLHADLESLLDRKIEDLETDRRKLEAIGLLNSFYLNDQFIYELRAPMSAQSFVSDGVLGQYLAAAITPERYKKIIQIFKLRTPNKKQYFKVTKTFDEVFPPLSFTEDVPGEDALRANIRTKQLKTRRDGFDWRFLKESLPEAVFDENELTDQAKAKIHTLHFVYQLDETDISDIYRRSVGKDRRLDIDKFTALAREHFKLKQEFQSKTNGDKQPVALSPREADLEPHELLAQSSPIEVLKAMGGGRASAADLRIAERLIDEVGLDPGVVNVLLAYIAKIKDGTLPGYDYFEKIGLNWKRNQISDAKTALAYVEHLRAKYAQSQGQVKTAYRRQKATKPDITLDWFDDYLKSLE